MSGTRTYGACDSRAASSQRAFDLWLPVTIGAPAEVLVAAAYRLEKTLTRHSVPPSPTQTWARVSEEMLFRGCEQGMLLIHHEGREEHKGQESQEGRREPALLGLECP